MSNEYWDNTPEDEVYEDDNDVSEGPFVFVNGSKLSLSVGAAFGPTIGDVAKQAGLGKFRVFLNGSEIMPSEAPENIGDSDRIELRRYDLAG